MGNALQEFAKWAIREGAFQAADLDGLYVQEKAIELGLLTETTYDPELHGPSDCAEKGESWFVFSDALTAGEREPVASRRWDKTYPGGQWLYFSGPDQDGQKLYTYPPASELEALRKERDEACADRDRWYGSSFSAEARLAEALKALEKSETLFETISHHIDEHSFSFAKGFCSQGAFAARRVRDGGQADVSPV